MKTDCSKVGGRTTGTRPVSFCLLVLVSATLLQCQSTTDVKTRPATLWGIIHPSEEATNTALIRTASGSRYRLTGKLEPLLRTEHEGDLVQIRGQVYKNPDEDQSPGEFEPEELLQYKKPN